MFYIISYDTPSDRRRRKMARIIRDFAERVQKSVFEAHLRPEDRVRLLAKLRDLVDPDEDDLRFYPVPLDTLKQVEILGRGKLTEEERAVVVA
jgi:CRISPR-associated protein Cas2